MEAVASGGASADPHRVSTESVPRPREETVGAAVGFERRPPGRPRSERASQAIMDAAVELLMGGVSVDALSVEAVAARAGVGKATVYRRWPNKEAVLLDAVASLADPPLRAPGRGLRRDLVELVEEFCTWLAESRPGRLLPRLLGAPELYGHYARLMIQPRIASLREVLREGVRDGVLDHRSDVETLLTVLTGSAVARIVLGESVGADGVLLDDRERAERIVDQVLLVSGARVPGRDD